MNKRAHELNEERIRRFTEALESENVTWDDLERVDDNIPAHLQRIRAKGLSEIEAMKAKAEAERAKSRFGPDDG